MARLEKLDGYIRVLIEPHDRVLEIGRQTKDEPAPFTGVPSPDATRYVVATREQTEIGRRQLRIEVLGPDRMRLANVNETNNVTVFQSMVSIGATLPEATVLGPGQSFESTLPVRVIRGAVQLRIKFIGGEQAKPADINEFQSLPSVPQSPNSAISIAKWDFTPEFPSDCSARGGVARRQSSPDFDCLLQAVPPLSAHRNVARTIGTAPVRPPRQLVGRK